ncbi:hypothetical protein [Streptomyces sp. NPDC006463]|uniref:hypothetical protein n=1 Tax=Streptomyces sp. NPDC006463 TaxID=3364746 RepID=UPI00367F4E60
MRIRLALAVGTTLLATATTTGTAVAAPVSAASPVSKCRDFYASKDGYAETYGTICWKVYDNGGVDSGSLKGTILDTVGADNKCAYANVKTVFTNGASVINETERACGQGQAVHYSTGRRDVQGLWVQACVEGRGCTGWR